MLGTVNIAGHTVQLKATASTIRKYRAWFNRDLIADFTVIRSGFTEGKITAEIFEMVENLTYVMAKQADPTISSNIDDWLDQFETFPISEFAADVINLWASSLESSSTLAEKNV
jgi:hypothetical protein